MAESRKPRAESREPKADGRKPKAESRWPKAEHGPESLKEIIGRLFTARGWGRRQERLQLECAWTEAVGPEAARYTRVVSFRRGVLEVLVGNAVLMQELTHFHKRRVLEQLRQKLPNTSLHDVRFRAGVVAEQEVSAS